MRFLEMAASQETVFGGIYIRTTGTPVVVVGASVTSSGGLMIILKAVLSSLLTRVLLFSMIVALRDFRNR